MRAEYGEYGEGRSPWGITAATVSVCGAVMFLVIAFSTETEAPILEAAVVGADPVTTIDVQVASEPIVVE